MTTKKSETWEEWQIRLLKKHSVTCSVKRNPTLSTLIPRVKLNVTVKSLNYTDKVSNLFQRDQSRVKLYFVIIHTVTHSLFLSLSFSRRFVATAVQITHWARCAWDDEGGRESCIHSRCSISWFRKIDKAFRQSDSLAWSVPKRPFVSVRNLMRAETQTPVLKSEESSSWSVSFLSLFLSESMDIFNYSRYWVVDDYARYFASSTTSKQ